MTVGVTSLRWPSDRAVLLVHGIGNASPGDYALLLQGVRDALGPDADRTAIYQLFYDQVNDWFAAKTSLGQLLSQAVNALAGQINDPELGPSLAEVCGDVLWPVLVADARAAVREAYLAQLKQMVNDGVAAGVVSRDQKLSIICHSLGCFHTYEVLHHAALFPSHQLQPPGVRFQNVIFMASPVQLIRTVASAMGSLVPNRRWLYTVQGDALSIPAVQKLSGQPVTSVRNWISITGDLDPVGGHFFRSREPWAYMDLGATQISLIDRQDALNISTKAQLAQALRASLRDREPPFITLGNPHSWENYVAGHAAELRQWITT